MEPGSRPAEGSPGLRTCPLHCGSRGKRRRWDGRNNGAMLIYGLVSGYRESVQIALLVDTLDYGLIVHSLVHDLQIHYDTPLK